MSLSTYFDGDQDPVLTGALGRDGRDGCVVVDVVGLGAGVYDRLAEQGYAVEAFHSSARVTGAARLNDAGPRFFKRRAEAYWRLRKMLEDGACVLPPDERLHEVARD